jgi:hypothetical protein
MRRELSDRGERLAAGTDGRPDPGRPGRHARPRSRAGEIPKTASCPSCGADRAEAVSAATFRPGSVCPSCGHVEPADEAGTAALPPAAQAVLDRFQLTEEPDPNPTPRAGEWATHRRARRLWTGPAQGIDDGYRWIEAVAELGWRANPSYGDWPFVAECFRPADADPEDNPEAPPPARRWMRLTYLERTVYLALYDSLLAATLDALPAPE